MIDISQSDDFHDANLLSVELNLAEQRLVVRVDAHLSQHESARTPVVLSFHGVRAFSATVDQAILHEHAAFGNISHWSPKAGSNLVSLAAGALMFEAVGFEVS